ARQYTVCFEEDVPNLHAVDFYVVPYKEKCPSRQGEKRTAPRLPDVTGHRLGESLSVTLLTGYSPKHIRVYKESDPNTTVYPKPLVNWYVCSQSPRAKTKFNPSDTVELRVARKCTEDARLLAK
ncbi:hypothetical protein, partial [Streptomyces sp. Tue6028]|uniref:hypothetical protein n=1 Tax=Streptomyces sp. Tue6028 TaxID=2036037 RepID=UPI003D71A164